MKKAIAAAILACSLTACAQPPAAPQQQAAPASAPAVVPPEAASPPPPRAATDAQVAPGKWDVERVRCSDLLGADDEDRASAAMFYFGYLAAKADIQVVDVSKISDNLGKVMKQCSATPSETVPQAFRDALAPGK